MPPSACCRKGTSSASVNTTRRARTASAAGRASKPSPGRLVPTCQRPMEAPTPVRAHNMFICSCCVDLTHQSATQLDTMLLTPFICLSYRCLSACFTVSRVGTGLLINQVKTAKGDVSQERPHCLDTAADLG